MKYLITAIAAVVLVGCGESQQSVPAPEAKPVEPVAEATQTKPPTAEAPDVSIHDAAELGDIEAIKKNLAEGIDVNERSYRGATPLHSAAENEHKEIAELLILRGADVNLKDDSGITPLGYAVSESHSDITELLINKGADVNGQTTDSALFSDG